MIVMPANSSGWFWHLLAHEHGRLGHLYSPGAQRGPWDWFPYALDNGAFSCWDPAANTFDCDKWHKVEVEWRNLLMWSQCAPSSPRWGIVPDIPGNGGATLQRWAVFAPELSAANIPLAIAVQDGMKPDEVRSLHPQPQVICVGGSTGWKWATVEMWAKEFQRVHVLRCNAPDKLDYLMDLGVESTDGTGWNRGDRKQTAGIEAWCRRHTRDAYRDRPLWPHVCRKAKDRNQLSFA